MIDTLRDSLRRYFGAWIIGAAIVLMAFIGLVAYLSVDTKTIETSLGTEAKFLKSNNAFEHWLGLSWKSQEALEDRADGMVFLFSKEKERIFWMRGMQFDLDVVWVKDGKVLKIDSNVKAPVDGEEPKKMTSSPFEVDAVIELPAGRAAQLGIKRGRVYEELQ